MRTFKCYDCGHTWELAYGEGGRGRDLICPQCGSHNIHRGDKPHGHTGWRRRDLSPAVGQQKGERRRDTLEE
jgi:DNA-directed RNA polymerase subunit RPC12/RpoP